MNKDLIGSLAWGVGILVLTLGAAFARRLGYADSDTVTRLVIGANGLMIAWFGNRMPRPSCPACGRGRSTAWRAGRWC